MNRQNVIVSSILLLFTNFECVECAERDGKDVFFT